MALFDNPPTPYPDVNAHLGKLMTGIQSVLGSQLVGLYLDGSLALGDFDQDSDIDFVAVVEDSAAGEDGTLSGATFHALRDMHDRLAQMDTPWAFQLEGSYLTRRAVRRYDPALTLFPNIERGRRERLKLADHDRIWVIHRWVLRERGIILFGPPPQTLVDPVSPEALREASRAGLAGWAAALLAHPERIQSRGYQSYIVLTLCRILYTLEHGAVASKLVAARWAREALAPRWRLLIEDSWVGRHESDGPPDPEYLRETLAMVQDTMESQA